MREHQSIAGNTEIEKEGRNQDPGCGKFSLHSRVVLLKEYN